MSRFIKHPKYSAGFDSSAYRMTVPEGYARYVVLDGFGPGGAALNIVAESIPTDAFRIDVFPSSWNPQPPSSASLTIRIGAKKPGSGKIRALFKGQDYSQPLPVQVPPDNDGTVKALQEAFRLSSEALAEANKRLDELRKAMVAAIGPMPFQANWNVIGAYYVMAATVLNMPDAHLQSGQVNATPKQKAIFITALPTLTGALDRIQSSIGLWVNGETPLLMRSDLEPDFAYVFGTTRDHRVHGIELEKLSFSYSGPLGRAATFLHERFHLTGAGHGEDFFKKKPKPQTGYEHNQNTFRRVDNAEAWRTWSAVSRTVLSIQTRPTNAGSEAAQSFLELGKENGANLLRALSSFRRFDFVSKLEANAKERAQIESNLVNILNERTE